MINGWKCLEHGFEGYEPYFNCQSCKYLRRIVLETIIDVAKKAEQNQVETPYNDYLTAAQQLLKKE